MKELAGLHGAVHYHRGDCALHSKPCGSVCRHSRCYNWGRRGWWSTSWIKASDAAKHPTPHGTAPHVSSTWPSNSGLKNHPDEAACLWKGLSRGLFTAQKGRKTQVGKPHALPADSTPGS